MTLRVAPRVCFAPYDPTDTGECRPSRAFPPLAELADTPLYRYLPESQLEELHTILQTEAQSIPYDAFLKALVYEDWYIQIANLLPERTLCSRKLAIFGLMAHLQGDIGIHELTAIQTIATLLVEGHDPKITTISTQKQLIDLMNEANMPLFNASYLPEPLPGARDAFVGTFFAKYRSPLLRTVCSYTLHDFRPPSEKADATIEMGVCYSSSGGFDRPIALRGDTPSRAVTLFSPHVLEELYRLASPHQELLHLPLRPVLGYDHSTLLKTHRPYTIPCPLLPPPPHPGGYSAGPPALGHLYHQTHYHLLIDSFNPLTPHFIVLGKTLPQPLAQLCFERDSSHFLQAQPEDLFITYLISLRHIFFDPSITFDIRERALKPLVRHLADLIPEQERAEVHISEQERAKIHLVFLHLFWMTVDEKKFSQADYIFRLYMELFHPAKLKPEYVTEQLPKFLEMYQLEIMPEPYRTDLTLAIGALIPDKQFDDLPRFASLYRRLVYNV